MDYSKHLKVWATRRQRIIDFIATGKSQGQAAIRFKVSRQRIQQVIRAEAHKMSHLHKE